MAIFQDIDTTDGGDTREEGFQKADANWTTLEGILSAETTKMLVGGGVGSAPVMTTATGSGSPVRATSPTLVTPVIGAATGTSLSLTGALTADTVSEKTSAAGVTIDGIKLKDGGSTVITGGTNTFNVTNGTASLDVAAGCAVDINGNLTVGGALTSSGTVTLAGGTNTINVASGTASLDIATAKVVNIDDNVTITNGLTVNGGYAGTMAFTAAGKTVTVSGSTTLNENVVAVVGKHDIWIPAKLMDINGTDGADEVLLDTTGEHNAVTTIAFDTTTQEWADFEIMMPGTWNSSVNLTAHVVWSHPAATSFGVYWGLARKGVANGEDLDYNMKGIGFGSTSDTGGNTDYIYISDAITMTYNTGEATVGELIHFRLTRDPTQLTDTLNVDARVHGVYLYYTTSAGVDP